MAWPLKTLKQNNLRLRVISGAILLPFALGVVWLGGWWFAVVIAVASGGMCVEWTRLSAGGDNKLISMAIACIAVVAILFLQFGHSSTSVGIVCVGTLVIWFWSKFRKIADSAITTFCLPYIASAGMAMVWLRNWNEDGFLTVVFLLCVVVAMDIGAYIVGRTFGGPKMAPRISPGKTWSGLIGGALCAGGVAFAMAILFNKNPALIYALAGSALGLLAQCGDLVESALKRRYGVKDSGAIIPGHGGLLDRFDGFLTVFPTAGLMIWLLNGSSVTWL
ncbi:MAG: phosphatidate cytidylyltransferase [Alphaproteobacteria bacterium]|nr:phosphatidate cytidylyltransferase [Alphaproteobacteria bacterium]